MRTDRGGEAERVRNGIEKRKIVSRPIFPALKVRTRTQRTIPHDLKPTDFGQINAACATDRDQTIAR